ncbi:MAG: UDP-N-acetylmuramoyl-L-alanine--D-glutamate ligase [Rhodospirillales bacterium]|nr:UDP-N-acetylmuramoyl-L-alanine--D-glutamate ligase [Rhodospirillales bacterium]
MIRVTQYKNRSVAVIGLGRSGLMAAQSLAAGGAHVWAWDDNEKARQKAHELGLPIAEPDAERMRESAALILSPGIPLTHPVPHPVVGLAKAAGCPIIGDLELLYRADRDATFVGITGTNGKSTTTTLLGHILEAAGKPVRMGGNIGLPVLGFNPVEEGGAYVLELSSYQLDLLSEAMFDVAVLINIAPDHLDRHGGMDGYVNAKKRIFADGDINSVAVVGIDDAQSARIFSEIDGGSKRRAIAISGLSRVKGGVSAAEGLLIDDLDGNEERILDLRGIKTLPGTHNWQNAAAAYAAARALGLAAGKIASGLVTYPGLEHRQEIAGSAGDIRFINDSKATNAEASSRALSCYENIYWIAGGLAKEGGIETLRPYFPRIRRAFLIGDAAEEFARTLGTEVDFDISETLDVAVAAAAKAAKADGAEGAVVLLSPACASFDQFADFEARGEAFKTLVEEIAAEGEGSS